MSLSRTIVVECASHLLPDAIGLEGLFVHEVFPMTDY